MRACMNTIGERISQRRKEMGLTQKAFAEKLHVSDKTVSRWETGRQIPDALTMQDIAKALDMSVSELYGVEQGGEPAQGGAEEKESLFRKIRKIFCLGIVFAFIILMLGLFMANSELNNQVSCQMGAFPMYMLTGYDQSIVEWVEVCNAEEKKLSHLSALGGDTAYYLFYLPGGCDETELDYSYRYGLQGRVLKLNFKNVSEQRDDKYYLCYMKFPCEDSIILKTCIDGKPVESYAAYAMFMGLCENILFK